MRGTNQDPQLLISVRVRRRRPTRPGIKATPGHVENLTQVCERHGGLLRLDERESYSPERKVRAKRQGRRLGNLLHYRQDELSADDLRRRLARVAQEVGAAWAWARPSDDESPPDPPAPHTHAPNAVSRAITLSRGDAAVVGDLLRVVDDAAPATGESEPVRTIRLG